MSECLPPPDVVVIGGGVIGLSIAWELSRHGRSVRVLEQGQFGQEASWAGAGMLPPGNPNRAMTVEAKLRSGSHILWPDWSERLRDVTGIDNGFHRCGGVEVFPTGNIESLDEKVTFWTTEGVTVEALAADALHARLPLLHPDIPAGYFLPELGQVRNPRHLKALYQACRASGVDLRSGCPVHEFVQRDGRIQGVRTATDEFQAAEYIIAGGAWSGMLLKRAGFDLPVEPVRGQIVLLESPPVIPHVIEVGSRYLVPRPDGRLLIGSTEERVGFEKRTTARGIAGLLEFGQQLIPALANARFERAWAGLRPFAPGSLPRIGRIPGTTNLTVAAGHFRAGLQLSPITAVLIREMMLQQPSQNWVAELSPAAHQ